MTINKRPRSTTLCTDITVVAARENNLRGVSVRIPQGQITVFTGVSGSGKSSLVFDTIAAESQRQLADTYSSFVRNRLPHYGKPDADRIDNLPVSIVVNQRRFSANARSTVGTAADISPLLRLLFSRIGRPFVGYSNAFSFNDPQGMCLVCEGLGTVSRVDEGALLDMTLSLNQGAIRFPTFAPGTFRWKRYVHSGLFDRDKPLAEYTPKELDILLHGEGFRPPNPDPEFPKTGLFEGVVPRFTRSYLMVESSGLAAKDRAELARVVTRGRCPACGGARLNPAALSCRIEMHSMADYLTMPVCELEFVIAGIDQPSVGTVTESLRDRLGGLSRVGLGYLSLDRASASLSGGEAQRVKLVRHLGSALTGVAYILDEPSTGLHPADVHLLNHLMQELRDKGNTVLVVEHDPDVIGIADHIVDMGPGAGIAGGTIVYEGDLAGLRAADTPTGQYLRAPRVLKTSVRSALGVIAIEHATRNNLRGVSVSVPLGVLTVVTGVAGSGKTSLINGALAACRPDAVVITQGALRGGARSTLSSYLGIQDVLRKLYAAQNHAPLSLFSANSRGACPVCKGRGKIVMDLAFLDDIETVNVMLAMGRGSMNMRCPLLWAQGTSLRL